MPARDRTAQGGRTAADATDGPTDERQPGPAGELAALRQEVGALRAQVGALAEALARGPAAHGTAGPPPRVVEERVAAPWSLKSRPPAPSV
jgi:hypothetical protein